MAQKRKKRGLVLTLLTSAAAIVVLFRRKMRPIDSAPILPPPPPMPPSEPPRITLPADIVNADEPAETIEATTVEAEAPLLEREVGGTVNESLDLAEAAEANDAPEMLDEEEDHEDPIGYCVSCRTKRHMHDAVEEKTENGRRGLRGTCEVCGSKMFRFLPNKD